MGVASSILGSVTLAARLTRVSLRTPRSLQRLDACQSLREIVETEIGLARFGDGELHYCLQGKDLDFQPWRRACARRLQRALLERNDRVLTAFNHYAAQSNELHLLKRYPRYDALKPEHRRSLPAAEVAIFDRSRARRAYARYWRLIEAESNKDCYGEASVFFLGIYVQQFLSGEMATVIDLLRRLFSGRRILFVAPRRPVGGPSFRDLAPDLKRLGVVEAEYVDIPECDAFAVIDEIASAILAASGFDDVFVQAGPTATVLASDLAGRTDARILDVGSLNTQIRHLL